MVGLAIKDWESQLHITTNHKIINLQLPGISQKICGHFTIYAWWIPFEKVVIEQEIIHLRCYLSYKYCKFLSYKVCCPCIFCCPNKFLPWKFWPRFKRKKYYQFYCSTNLRALYPLGYFPHWSPVKYLPRIDPAITCLPLFMAHSLAPCTEESNVFGNVSATNLRPHFLKSYFRQNCIGTKLRTAASVQPSPTN